MVQKTKEQSFPWTQRLFNDSFQNPEAANGVCVILKQILAVFNDSEDIQ